MKSKSIIVAALFSALALPVFANDAAAPAMPAAMETAPKAGHADEHKKGKHGHKAEHKKKEKHMSKTEHAAEAPMEKPATDAMPAAK